MPRLKRVVEAGILTAALVGLEAQRERLEEQIGKVRALLGRGKSQEPDRAVAKPRAKRRLSRAARARISAAQKRRWEAFRQRQIAA